MPFVKKIIVINAIEQGYGGVLKMEVEKWAVCTLKLIKPLAGLTLLINIGGKIFKFSPAAESFKLEIKEIQFAHCLVVKDKKPVAYGSTASDKNLCLMLLNELEAAPPEHKEEDCAEQPAEEKPPEPKKEEPKTKKEEDKNSPPKKDDIKIPRAEPQRSVRAAASKSEKSEISSEHSPSFVLDEGVQYEGNNFYQAVKPQLDEMFVCYPAYQELQQLVPFSQWIKIDMDEDFYVVGVIFTEMNEVKYIAYGIHGIYSLKPPDEVKNVCRWLPLSEDAAEGEGFWVIYQEPLTGKCVKNLN